MSPPNQLIGNKFNRLFVNERVQNNKHGKAMFRCTCECGNIVDVESSRVKNGHTKSCGCLQKERARYAVMAHSTTHGMSGTPTFTSWTSMRNRCYRVKDKEYANYGGRGIVVCDEWRNSFQKFYEDLGERPEGSSLDRIDTDGGYTPQNCKWSTPKEQAQNRRGTQFISFNGMTKCVAEWERFVGLGRNCIGRRLKAGWDIERALTTGVTT